jgi:hypothetical protein
MKKIIPLLVFFMSAGIFSAHAQETKTKPITTPSDKVHNVLHPKKKIDHGTKYKHKSVTGKKTVTIKKKPQAEALKPKTKVKAK